MTARACVDKMSLQAYTVKDIESASRMEEQILTVLNTAVEGGFLGVFSRFWVLNRFGMLIGFMC